MTSTRRIGGQAGSAISQRVEDEALPLAGDGLVEKQRKLLRSNCYSYVDDCAAADLRTILKVVWRQAIMEALLEEGTLYLFVNFYSYPNYSHS